MFRILIGATLLTIGFAILSTGLADTHTTMPSDPRDGYTWLLWGMIVVPIALGLWVLFGKRVRRMLR